MSSDSQRQIQIETFKKPTFVPRGRVYGSKTDKHEEMYKENVRELLGKYYSPPVDNLMIDDETRTGVDRLESKLEELVEALDNIRETTETTLAGQQDQNQVLDGINSNTEEALVGLGGVSNEIKTFQRKTLAGLGALSSRGAGLINECAPPKSVSMLAYCILMLLAILMRVAFFITTIYWNFIKGTTSAAGSMGKMIPFIGNTIGTLFQCVMIMLIIMWNATLLTDTTRGMINGNAVLKYGLTIFYKLIVKTAKGIYAYRNTITKNYREIAPDDVLYAIDNAPQYLNKQRTQAMDDFLNYTTTVASAAASENVANVQNAVYDTLSSAPSTLYDAAVSAPSSLYSGMAYLTGSSAANQTGGKRYSRKRFKKRGRNIRNTRSTRGGNLSKTNEAVNAFSAFTKLTAITILEIIELMYIIMNIYNSSDEEGKARFIDYLQKNPIPKITIPEEVYDNKEKKLMQNIINKSKQIRNTVEQSVDQPNLKYHNILSLKGYNGNQLSQKGGGKKSKPNKVKGNKISQKRRKKSNSKKVKRNKRSQKHT